MNLVKSNFSNIPKSIEVKIGKNLHLQKNHPICIIKEFIYKYFNSLSHYNFYIFDNLSPIVSTENNFDKLLIPKDHPARSTSDTYYVNETMVLRTHTSAHQNELLAQKYTHFLVTGDVYRKDEIDRTHYPVFHQTEFVIIVDDDKDPEKELETIIIGLINYLFPKYRYRFNPDYFPFTEPSFEVEIEHHDHHDQWIEILGCGVIQPSILGNNDIYGKRGIACGFGLERLAMLLFNIPDIRFLWLDHPKFLKQFSEGKITQFKPYSDLPAQNRDISFWVPDHEINNKKWIRENDFFEQIREIESEWIEEVRLLDKFYHEKKNKHSRTYRITYSATNPTLKNSAELTDIVTKIHNNIGKNIIIYFGLELR
jgi:phenylalanyl-tRNA synthetase alpha chain